MVVVGISKRIKSPRILSYRKSITERKYTASYGTRTEKQKAERIGSRYYSYDQNGNVIAERDNAPAVDTDIFRPYYQDGDLYWTNYGFGVVHALPRQDDGTYQRVYRWNERNLLSESSDSLYTVHYRYGADGQRALKYVSNTKISTLYFNKMWQITDSRAEWLQSKHIYVGESRIATKYNSEGTANTDAESTRTYYYHSDHLGSAQTVTNHAGAVHERLEYTPYGELWIDWRSDTAPEDATPFRFTGQILDPETGLYYYGARYLDPKTSRWLGVDPAMAEYVPARGQDVSKLSGMGGVYNTINLHTYHYAANNPIRYIDPDGRTLDENDIQNALNSILAASPNATASTLGDLINTENISEILKNNSSHLDIDSRFYVNKNTKENLQSSLDNINVIMGVDLNATIAAIDKLGFDFGNDLSGTRAISVGNTILVFGTMQTDSNGRVINQGDADLLGHEAIHSLQVLAVGGITNAANIYSVHSRAAQMSGRDPYYGNSREIGAYNFGPFNVDAIRAGSLPNPIFSRYQGWHR